MRTANKINVSLVIDPDLYTKMRELAEKLEKSFVWTAAQAFTKYLHEFDLDAYYFAKMEAQHNAEVTDVPEAAS